MQISDYGSGGWISGFPLEWPLPVPEQTLFDRGDQSALDAYADDGCRGDRDAGQFCGCHAGRPPATGFNDAPALAAAERLAPAAPDPSRPS